MERPGEIRWLPVAEARQRAERAAAALAEDPRVQLVFLFGSTVRPGADKVRDVDLAVLTDPALELMERCRLAEQLEKPAGGPVDLVPLNDAPIVLAWEVADSGECLYAVDEDLETEWVLRARARYWDFKPYLDEQYRLTGVRNREKLYGPES